MNVLKMFSRLALATSIAVLPVLASSAEPTPQKVPPFHADQLKDFPDTPYLPKFSGKAKFIEGVAFPNAPGGASLTVKFKTQAPPQAVFAWYKSSFAQYGWKVEDGATNETGRTIGGMNQRNRCYVYVSSSSERLFGSVVIVMYRFAKADSRDAAHASST